MSALGPSQPDRPSHGLWSLWDMLRVYAQKYIQIGAKIAFASELFDPGIAIKVDEQWIGRDPETTNALRADKLREVFKELQQVCEDIDLPVSTALIKSRVDSPPTTESELDAVMDAVVAEIKTRIFLFVSPQTARFYENDDLVNEATKDRFPTASDEIRSAANCLALDQYTASVFHAMRAAEIGARALAAEASIPLKHHVDLADWQDIQTGMQTKVNDIGRTPRSLKRDTDLEFYGQAAAQLQFFKDGWRVRVMHARATYNQAQALEAVEHVRSFFDVISKRIAEPL